MVAGKERANRLSIKSAGRGQTFHFRAPEPLFHFRLFILMRSNAPLKGASSEVHYADPRCYSIIYFSKPQPNNITL